MGQTYQLPQQTEGKCFAKRFRGKKKKLQERGRGGGKIFVKHNSEGYMSRIMYLVNVHVTVIDQ